MQEVTKGLYVGSLEDYESSFSGNNYAVVHACKEPYHREYVGYTSRGAPKDSAEYLWATRGHHIALNMVDAANSAFFSTTMVEAALNFLCFYHMREGTRTVIHCNEGKSRAPGLAMLYMATQGFLPSIFFDAELAFKALYPDYAPGEGWREHIWLNWSFYMERRNKHV